MNLICQQGKTCLITAASMVFEHVIPVPLDTSVKRLIAAIGHDGSEPWWGSEYPRGHHIQEIIGVGLSLFDVALVPYDAQPHSAPPAEGFESRPLYPEVECERRLFDVMLLRPGIILGLDHAYAWDGYMVYDPNGRIMLLTDVPAIRTFYRAYYYG